MKINFNSNFLVEVYGFLVCALIVVLIPNEKWFKESLQCDSTNPFNPTDPVVIGGILQSSPGIGLLVLIGLLFYFGRAKGKRGIVLVVMSIVVLLMTTFAFQSGARSIERIISTDTDVLNYNAWVCARRSR